MPFPLQPHLKGTLLELRPLKPEDFELLYAVASDPLIWEQHPAHDRWKKEIFQSFFTEAIASGGAFLVLDTQSNNVIGSSRFYGYNEEKSEIEIGFTFLARSHWGNGGGGSHNRQMKHLMLTHAFQYVRTVLFSIGINNHRSRKAVEKLGATLAETRTNPTTGQQSVLYKLTPTTYRP